ncbi:MerR family transcriptional regulator [Longispora sp. NPDC051575]|uniref:MerR family transcriptional regulator n=1 Tax=Longispora sp. NPDC051575 TaxID=3154943 RepID=UPI003434C2E2
MMLDKLLKIGQLAAHAGVSPRTVDYYTTLGLISPAQRTDSGYRLYDPATVERIAAIRQLEAHGASLDDIAAALTRPGTGVLTDDLAKIDRDIRSLRDLADNAADDIAGLVAAMTARAHGLIQAAIDLIIAAPDP